MANIIETLKTGGNHSHFIEHIEAAGLTGKLSGEGSFTVFAPTDSAVAKLSEETLKAVGSTPHMLANVVSYHVLEGKYTSTDLEGLSTATTLLGEDVELHNDDNKQKVDGAHISKADVAADNGVIHAIDTVLVPEVAALALQK
jgi:uncharacterized surface protein with fasciclin (FAS1) repeats